MTVSTPELSCSFLSSANEKINISYQLHGNGKNKLLLISGMGTNGSIWQYLTPYLEDFTICTFDLRGTGFSSTPYSYSIEVFSEDALQVVDHLKWNKFHLGGISMGGFICLKLVQKCPSRILSQTLISTALQGAGIPSWTAIVLLWIVHIAAIFSFKLRNYFVAPLLYPVHYLRSNDRNGITNWKLAIERLHQSFMIKPHPRLRGAFGHLWASWFYKLSANEIERIQSFNLPSIVIGGSDDLLVQPHFTSKVASKLSYPLYILEGVGHAPISQGDTPKRIAEIMNRHFAHLILKVEK